MMSKHNSIAFAIVVVVSMIATITLATPAPTSPQIGNGYLATFVNNSDVFVAGVFNGQGSNSQRAPFRATTRVFPTQYATAPFPTVYELSTLRAVASYNVGTDSPVATTLKWYAHRTQKHLLVQTLDFQAVNTNQLVPLINFGDDGDASSSYNGATNILGSLVIELVVVPSSHPAAFNSTDIGGTTFSASTIDAASPINASIPLVVNATVTEYQTIDIEEPAFFGNVTVCEVSTMPPSSVLLKGTRGSLKVFTVYCTSAPWDNAQSAFLTPCACAIQRMEAALSQHYSLEAEHATAWASLWQAGPKVSVTDPTNDLGDAVIGSMYSLLSSLHADVPYSTSPGGLPTNGYRGHTFWDMETWMFPNLALFYPEIAYGSAIRYRLNRFEGAEQNAVNVVGGKGGAAFPWESAFSGYDVCPWPQGEHSEIHITADVVLAWRLAYYLSLNTTLLSELFPLLNATSYFWSTRCTKDAATGQWNLDLVTPPDEYHFGNNSVYTNAAVKLAVNFTLEAADVLGVALPAAYRAILTDLVDNLVILYDATENYHPEFYGYNGTSIVKQADVILLNFPMGYGPLQPSTIANDLVYYEWRTDPGGPAMTWSMFAVGYLSLPNGTVANATATGFYYLNRGYQENTYPPYYQWYEVAGGSGCPNFLTGAGGFLQSIWAGLLQLRIVGPGALVVLPTSILPPTVNCTAVNGIHLAGSVLDLSLCRTTSQAYQLTVTLTSQGPSVIEANNLALRVNTAMSFDVSSTVSVASIPF